MLTEDEVLDVAKLARLDLDKVELDKFQKQLENVLELFKDVEEVDVENVNETSQITGLMNIVRKDEVKCDVELKPCNTSELLQNIPIKDGSNIVVPKVIDMESGVGAK
jgi:aspartyl-tRNA(Asn)/glutamyl-tRNA(Gln) amidotransferase subunit C